MSIGATGAAARVAAIEQMVAQLGGTPAAGGAGFQGALASAQAASGAAASGGPVAAGSVPFADEINAAAAKHGVDPALLAGLVKQESGFNPSIRSPAGATGLTQLMPATARSLGVSDPTDPVQALDGGAKYLRQQLDRFGGDERLALAAYNAGPGAVQRYGGVPPFAETQHYVQAVLAGRDAYAARGLSLGAGTGASGAGATPTGATGGGVGTSAAPAAGLALAGGVAMAAQPGGAGPLRTTLSSPSTFGPTSSSSGLGYPTT